MKALCVVGKSGSGKSTFLEIAASLNLASYDMSSVIYEEVEKRGLSSNPLEVIKFANELREKHGRDVVAKLLFEKIKEKNHEKVVISGLRSMDEYIFFKEKMEKTLLLYLKADIKLRYERVAKRKKKSNPSSFEEFVKKDEKENLWGMKELIENSDIIIENNSSIEEFKKKSRNLLSFIY